MLLLQNYEIFTLLSRLFFFSRALEAGFHLPVPFFFV